MTVTVVIPWRDVNGRRRQILEWLTDRYAARHPAWGVQIASVSGTGDWCKGEVIAAGADAAPDGILVVADADVWCDGLADAVDAVAGGAAWARPHRLVHRLTASETDRVLAGTEPTAAMRTLRRPYRGTGGGAFVVVRRETVLDVPPDRRFCGWGNEDGAWRDALRTLAGREWCGPSPCFHLEHPPQPDCRQPSPANVRLADRYIAARGNRRLMRQLVEAGR